MEVTAQVPQTGTQLRIDADRQFDQQPGDSVLRVQGQSDDGSAVFDAVYVEVTNLEAQAIAQMLQWLQAPPPQLEDQIAQEVQATFRSRLSGRDAAQVAQIAHQAQWQAFAPIIGIDPKAMPNPAQGTQQQNVLTRLAERFSRAAAKRQAAYSGGSSETYSNGGGESPGEG